MYHYVISHPIEKCFVFKDKVMELAQQDKISFDKDVEVSNIVSAMNDPLNEPIWEIRFGPFPIEKSKADLTSPMFIGGPTPFTCSSDTSSIGNGT